VLPPAYGNRQPPTITALAWNGSTLYAVDGRYNRIFAVHTTLPPLPIQVTKTGLVDNGTVTVLPLPPHLLLGPQALAVAANGSLWVADTDHRRLFHLTPTGQILRTIALHDGPYGVAVLPSGRIVVTGYYGGTVAWVNPHTSQLHSFGFTAGSGPDQLQHPTTVIPLPQGGFAIWDTGNQRAVLTNAAGTPITWITSPAGATAMTVLPAGTIAWTTAAGLIPWAP
jgi:streptogramin lyase